MARHTFDPAEIVGLLQRPSGDRDESSDPTCTIDVATFQETFGVPGSVSASARRNRRRETADPSKLRELLENCEIDDAADEAAKDGGEEEDDEETADRTSSRQRRMTCDPRLLKQMAMTPGGALSVVSEGLTEATTQSSLTEMMGAQYYSSERTATEATTVEPMDGETTEEQKVPARQSFANSKSRRRSSALGGSSSSSSRRPSIATDAAVLLEEEEGEDEFDDDFDAQAYNNSRRGSVAWSFDEQRATLQELRRQLKVEKELATDAESERDELAKELAGLRSEQSARQDLLEALETQRDAAIARAMGSEQRAARAEQAAAAAEAHRMADAATEHARVAEARAEASYAKDVAIERVADGESAAKQAQQRAEAAEAHSRQLTDDLEKMQARVKSLERVKITKSFAAKVHETVEERDRLQVEVHKLIAEKENNGVSAIKPFTTSDHHNRALPTAANNSECRQS